MKENKLGEIISKLRKEKSITQKDLADEIHVSDKAISRWETGKSAPNLENIYELSKYFKVSFKTLLEARVNDNAGDDLVQEIVQEFTDMNSKSFKRIKKFFIGAISMIILLVAILIFTNTFNRFKVYKVAIESSDFLPISGIYVETNIKDTLHLSNISLRNVKIKNTDTISIDLYFIENDQENIMYTFSRLYDLNFDSYQSYVKIDDLSKYFDNMYLRLTIVNEKDDVKQYETKLNFIKDFSNNTLYIKEDNENILVNNLSSEEVMDILLENGFVKANEKILVKNTKNFTIRFVINSNKITYSYEDKKFIYRYNYSINKNTLDVLIYDKNNIEIENYSYDISKEKITECNTGSCNNYKQVLKALEENVLYLLH